VHGPDLTALTDPELRERLAQVDTQHRKRPSAETQRTLEALNAEVTRRVVAKLENSRST
jgi:hypothetical protein